MTDFAFNLNFIVYCFSLNYLSQLEVKIQKIFDGVNFHAFLLKLPRTQVSGYLSQVQMLHYTLYSLTRMQLLTKCTKILLKPKLFKHSFKTFRMANTTLILWKLQLYDKGWKTIGNIFIASLQLGIILRVLLSFDLSLLEQSDESAMPLVVLVGISVSLSRHLMHLIVNIFPALKKCFGKLVENTNYIMMIVNCSWCFM